MPETYVIFVTENDVLEKGLPIYHIERTVLETGDLFNDDEHIIYVNGAHEDMETELGKLMHDFRCSDPDDMVTMLKNKVYYFKKTDEGRNVMCKAIEEMRNEASVVGYIIALLQLEKNEEEIKQKIASTYSCISDDDIARLITEAKEELFELA